MKILIDNGQDIESLDKCSPDKLFREYADNRDIARVVVEHLKLRRKLWYNATSIPTLAIHFPMTLLTACTMLHVGTFPAINSEKTQLMANQDARISSTS